MVYTRIIIIIQQAYYGFILPTIIIYYLCRAEIIFHAYNSRSFWVCVFDNFRLFRYSFRGIEKNTTRIRNPQSNYRVISCELITLLRKYLYVLSRYGVQRKKKRLKGTRQIRAHLTPLCKSRSSVMYTVAII